MAADPSSRVVFGVRPVEELCRARPREVAVVYLAEGHRSREIDGVVAVAKDRGIAVEIRPRSLVASLPGRRPTRASWPSLASTATASSRTC